MAKDKTKQKTGKKKDDKKTYKKKSDGMPAIVKDNTFLEIDDLCKLLHVCPMSVYRMVKENRIPFYKPCKSLLFDREEILSWIRERKAEKKRRASA